MQMKIFPLAMVGLATWASAHLTPDSLTPKGGEVMKAGSTFTIKWGMDEAHKGIDLALSTDGKTWSVIKSGLGASAVSFNWKVPDLNTQTARVRVCQRDLAGCTDAQNVSDPSADSANNPGNYVLVSGNFTIQGSAAVNPPAPEPRAASIRYDSRTGNLHVTYDLPAAGKVSLRAYDIRGQRVATLLEEDQAAGPHALSLDASPADLAAPVLFRLQTGDRVSAQAWKDLR